MARSSPGVQRVVAILNFFADHPGQPFTLTDLVRALRLSRATCHAILVGLVEAGFLYRASDKSYVLGPALAAIGRAANANLSPLQVAQPEMRLLADQYDAICSAVFREGNEVVVRERAASVSHLGYSIPRGTRLPLAPPFGAIYFAWSKPAQADAWLDQLIPAPSHEMRRRMHANMEFVRSHGFGFVNRNLPVEPSSTETEWLLDDQISRHPVALMAELEEDAQYQVRSFIAPVFDGRSDVAFVLALMGVLEPLSGREILTVGSQLRGASDRITRFIGGSQLPV